MEIQEQVIRKCDSNSAVRGDEFGDDASPQFAQYRVSDNAEEDDNIVLKFVDGQKYADSSDTEIIETAPEKKYELKIQETYHPCKFQYQAVRT